MDRRFKAALIAGLTALALVAGVRQASAGDYNLNPQACHNLTPWDLDWYMYQCWKPDPPDGEGGIVR